MRTAVILSLLLLTGPVYAQEGQEQGEEQAEQARPQTPPYALKLQNGIRLSVARDYEGATAAFREAIQANPSQPQAYYLLGEVQRMQAQLDGALESFRDAKRIAEQASSPAWQARAMQAIAETLERQEGQLEAARQAWTEYARFADTNRGVASPEIARARIQAIDVVNEQEQAYVAVRERIAERERENAEDDD